jgi:hypothetical protein
LRAARIVVRPYQTQSVAQPFTLDNARGNLFSRTAIHAPGGWASD